ncbi:MAG TPA: type II secretion system protein GspM [Myxococcota bacterium]|nr:type II secretion system protein GspM [Myxococcota bacterium]
MSELLARVRNFLANLSARERLLVGGVGGLFGLLVVYGILIRPVLGMRGRAAARVVTAEQDIAAMARLRAEYDEVNGRLAAVEQRIAQGPSGNIFTTLESLAKQSAITVDSMEPQAAQAGTRYRETKVQVVLKGVTLAQMVSYLQGIESAPQLLSIKSLRVRTRADKPDLLDVTFTVSSFEPA